MISRAMYGPRVLITNYFSTMVVKFNKVCILPFPIETLFISSITPPVTVVLFQIDTSKFDEYSYPVCFSIGNP